MPDNTQADFCLIDIIVIIIRNKIKNIHCKSRRKLRRKNFTGSTFHIVNCVIIYRFSNVHDRQTEQNT